MKVKIELGSHRREMLLFLSSKIGCHDVSCTLALGLSGTLNSTNYLNLFADLMFEEVMIQFRVQFRVNLLE